MIPKIIHFIYGLEPDFGGKPFSFVHWAAVKSAIRNNPGYRVLFWYQYLPDNYYFNDIKHEIQLDDYDDTNKEDGAEMFPMGQAANFVKSSIFQLVVASSRG